MIKLSGQKEASADGQTAADLQKAQKELFDRFEGIKEELRRELESVAATRIDVMAKAKLDKMQSDLDTLATRMKENNKNLDDLQSNLLQKLAAHGTHTTMGAKERAQATAEQASRILSHFMRTGEVSNEGAQEYGNLSGKKDSKWLVGDNEFVIPAEIDATIDVVLSKESDILNAVNVVTTSTRDYRKLVNRRGTGIGKAGEDTTRVLQEKPALSVVEPKYGELYARFHVSSHALDDAAFSVESEFQTGVAVDMAEAIDTDVVLGDGINTIKGLGAYSLVNTPTWGSITRVQTAGPIAYDDIVNLIYTPARRYRANGSFLIGKQALRTVRAIKDDSGQFVFQPSFNEGRFAETILGYPVYESEAFGNPAVDGSRLAYFGDFSRGYLLHMLRGTRMIRDPYTLKGFVEFYIWRRWGGAVADFNAIACLQKTVGSS